jgi:hypothetical protein
MAKTYTAFAMELLNRHTGEIDNIIVECPHPVTKAEIKEEIRTNLNTDKYELRSVSLNISFAATSVH